MYNSEVKKKKKKNPKGVTVLDSGDISFDGLRIDKTADTRKFGTRWFHLVGREIYYSTGGAYEYASIAPIRN